MLPYIDIHTHTPRRIDTNNITIESIILKDDNLVIPDIACTVGIHPRYIYNSEQQLAKLKSLALSKQVIAIGECGLDRLAETDFAQQQTIFARHAELAQTYSKPLVIHCVRAYSEILQTLKQQRISIPVIFHGFSKKIQLADQLLAEGCFLSLGPKVLDGHHEQLIQHLPLDRIFFETDGKIDEVKKIYQYFCAVRKIDESLLKEQILLNFQQVFKTIFLILQ